MRILSNEDVEQILTMPECLAALEEMFRDDGQGLVLPITRVDNIVPCSHPDAYYAFKHMGGIWPRRKIMALRINSDVVTHPSVGGKIRRVKAPLANGRWVGLVELFSTETGQLLAIFPDGVAQRMRVGATSGLGIRYLAREDSKRAGILGSGWQAGAALLALLAVRPIEEVKVYSSTREHRETFAREMSHKTGVKVHAVESGAECASEVDILLAATSSMQSVIDAAWLCPGVHVGCIKLQEIDPAVLSRCDRVAVHTSTQIALVSNILPGTPHVAAEDHAGWWNDGTVPVNRLPQLADLVTGKAPGRTGPHEITCFVNNIGTGLQFAAVGSLILDKAQQLGIGRDLPDDWFSETVHP